ncbi:MAG: MFS transporter [Anaerolineaceae bacterium]|nr:MFS transporter [Anaerolineaceae bacterium]
MSQVTELLQKQAEKRTNYRWVVMTLVFLIYTIAMADRVNLGVALPYIRKEFGMSNTDAGTLVSLVFFFYAISQIPAGFLYKKLGVRKVFPISMILTSVFTGLMGVTSSFFMMKMFRAGLGLAEGPTGIGCTATINSWFPAKEKGTATGIWLAASKFGPVIVPPICVLVIEMFGWREIFLFFAIPGILFSLAWFFLVTNKPADSKFCSQTEVDYIQNEQESPVTASQPSASGTQYSLAWLDKLIRAKKIKQLDTVGQVFRSWNVFGNAIGYGCMIGVSNTMLAWIPTYLINVKHFTSMKMGFLASAPFVGAVLGNLLGGVISDRVLNKRRKPLMLVSAICTTITMYALVYAPNNAAYLAGMLFAAGFLLSLGYSAFAVYPMGVTSKETYPIAFGIVNTGGQLGGAVAPLIVGMILDAYNWDSVFLFLALSSVLCFVVLATIDEPIVDSVPDTVA